LTSGSGPSNPFDARDHGQALVETALALSLLVFTLMGGVTCVRIRPKGIDDAACAKFLKRKIDVVVPYAEKADAAADLGVPYVLAEKTDPTSLAIKQLGTKLGSFKPVLG
jgi:hypothetical protein